MAKVSIAIVVWSDLHMGGVVWSCGLVSSTHGGVVWCGHLSYIHSLRASINQILQAHVVWGVWGSQDAEDTAHFVWLLKAVLHRIGCGRWASVVAVLW